MATAPARCRSTTLVQKLLADGVDPDVYKHRHLDALTRASGLGHVEIVKALLAAGAGAAVAHNTRGELINYALPWACRNGHLAVVEALLAAGADVKEMFIWTSMIEAIENDRLEIVQALLRAGVNPEIGAVGGERSHLPAHRAYGYQEPLPWARHRKNPEIAQALRDAVATERARAWARVRASLRCR